MSIKTTSDLPDEAITKQRLDPQYTDSSPSHWIKFSIVFSHYQNVVDNMLIRFDSLRYYTSMLTDHLELTMPGDGAANQ